MMELNKVYFYTATIVEWKHLLKEQEYKDIIINSLKHLSEKKLFKVYAFVIMPNHIHLIWHLTALNGKEMPHASLMKFTSHQFLEKIRIENPELLIDYQVQSKNRMHQFWQRDPMAIELYTRKVFEQKLNYIHNNPLQERWCLVENAADYKFSSAKYYETEIDDYGFLNHYAELF
jgi:putative transposase